MKSLLFLLTFTFVLLSSDWEYERTKDGIDVYRRPYGNTGLFEYRGVAIVPSSVEVLVAIIEDVAKRPKWFKACKVAKEVPSKNSGTTLIYTQTNMPFPLKERVSVWERKEQGTVNSGIFSIQFMAVPESQYPLKDKYVRVNDGEGRWDFRRIDENKTEVTYSFGCNPEGGIPMSMVNMASKNIPVNTINGLRKAVLSGYYLAKK